MAKEYIEREALLNALKEERKNGNFVFTSKWIKEIMDNLPTADAVEVRHGNWLTKEYQYGEDGVSDEWIEKTAEQGDYAYCSLCLKEALLNGCEDWVLSDYYPHCGARMDGKDK